MIFNSETKDKLFQSCMEYFSSDSVYAFGMIQNFHAMRTKIGIRFVAAFDNNELLVNNTIEGCKVLSLSDIKKIDKIKIVIMSPTGYVAIRRQLLDMGLREFYDFIDCTFLLMLADLYFKNKIIIKHIDHHITDRCTLDASIVR